MSIVALSARCMDRWNRDLSRARALGMTACAKGNRPRLCRRDVDSVFRTAHSYLKKEYSCLSEMRKWLKSKYNAGQIKE